MEKSDFDIQTSIATQSSALAEEAGRIEQVGQLLGYLAGEVEKYGNYY